MSNDKKYDIYDRAFNFAARTAKFLDGLPKSTALNEYSRQLIRASGSIGANIAEADGALTKRDFTNKMGIARREAKESKHWLRLIEAAGPYRSQSIQKELTALIQESAEILLILSAIIRNTGKNN